MSTTPFDIRLAKARTNLLLNHPFFGAIAMGMNLVVKEDIPARACTDGKTIWFQPSALDSWTDDNVLAVLAHECLHPMLEHNYRLNGRNHRKYNRAGDYVINEIIVDDCIGKLPDNVLQDTSIYEAGGRTTDGIYYILPDLPDDNDPGIGDGDIIYKHGTPAEMEQACQEAKGRLAQAAQTARMAGKLSGGVKRLVEDILYPKVRWQDVMYRFLDKTTLSTRTYARPARRFIAQGMYFPSRTADDTVGELVFAVDCSGSIGDKELAEFAAEIHEVHSQYRPSAIHILYFDSEISHYDMFEPDDDVEIAAHGGGGTAFSPIFEFIRDKEIDPIACIVLTDLCCSDFGDQPNYPVLWVSNYSDEAPWGEVIKM